MPLRARRPDRGARPRATRWQVAVAHGHYEPPATRANPLRPSWVFGDEEIAATAADYLALGHWDRPMQVGSGAVRIDGHDDARHPRC